MSNVTVTGETVSVNPQQLLTPSLADVFVRVLDFKGQEVSQPRAELKKLFNNPSLSAPILAANAGQPGQTQVSSGSELYMVDTRPIVSKSHKVIGVLQVAQPISWVGDALSRPVRQLGVAAPNGNGLRFPGPAFLASRSIRPICRGLPTPREIVSG